MEPHEQAPVNKSKSGIRKVLELLLMVVILFIVIEGGIVFFARYTAGPAKKFCGSVTVNDAFDGVRSRAVDLKFNIRQLKTTTTGEQRFKISKHLNSESHCLVYVKDGRVSKKQYFLYLF